MGCVVGCDLEDDETLIYTNGWGCRYVTANEKEGKGKGENILMMMVIFAQNGENGFKVHVQNSLFKIAFCTQLYTDGV